MAPFSHLCPHSFLSLCVVASCCVFTVNFTHPIETVKTRSMQVTGDDGLGVVVRNTLKNEGVGFILEGASYGHGDEKQVMPRLN